jgi:hypothetical protein
MSKEEILDKALPRMSYIREVLGYPEETKIILTAMQEYADQETKQLRAQLAIAKEALERLANLSHTNGVPGCTYSDTDYDSMSAAYGYNQAVGNARSIAAETLKQLEQ